MAWPFSGKAKTASTATATAETPSTEAVDLATGGDAAAAIRGIRRMFQGNRVIWVIAIVAIVCLLAGVLLSQFVISPGQAAANAKPPKAGLITVPVEEKVLENKVVIRGDIEYADSVDVTIETADLGGPAVVTGQLHEVGATLNPASIALEVAGRPVIVLSGELPVYRTLRVGVSGPDVLQLKQALSEIGINPGDASSASFDAATAAAVRSLYERVGYTPPASPEGASDAVRSANEGVRSAEESLAAARRAVGEAQAGPSAVERLRQNNMVAAAQRVLDRAVAGADPNEIIDAEEALALAKAERDQALAPRDTSAEAAGVRAATEQLATARELLGDARKETLTSLPAGEVLYLPGLPRRVDEVMVKRGSNIQGAVMRVSGATLVVSASASESDAKLLEEGGTAVLSTPDGVELVGTITKIAPVGKAGSTEAGRYQVLLEPESLTEEQRMQLQGNNVRISIPVNSTGGKVLSVPLAALTAGPGGESRVEVSTGDGDKTRLVTVTTGLAAGGYVEISSAKGKLGVGDLVVVGR